MKWHLDPTLGMPDWDAKVDSSWHLDLTGEEGEEVYLRSQSDVRLVLDSTEEDRWE